MLCLTVAVAMLPSCNKAPSVEEMHKKATQDIGMDASITARFLASAMKACDVVGVHSLDECAKLDGPLLEDKTASETAQMAVSQRAGYWASCLKKFSDEYCTQLLRRALTIALRKQKGSPAE